MRGQALALSLLLCAGSAHAEEPQPLILTRPAELPTLHAATLAPHPFQLETSRSLEEIRLSHGAKVAIIVTSIVVGALIIVGVIAISAPHHP